MDAAYARQVFDAEIAGLKVTRDKIDEHFEKALLLLTECKARVIISGMGKAGIIAKKIAATMASTGTQSFFLHPAEALHGDLGMVTENDVCVLLSNSGESDEITRLLPGIRKIGAKIIAITGNERSTLAAQADIFLDLGHIEEACPLGLAPSATTTAMLALGDALALCLMRMRNFKIEDYALFHPAGALGRKTSPIREFMRKGEHLATVLPEVSVGETLLAISSARCGAAVVIDDNSKVVGIFCDGDLRRGLEKDPQMLQKPVKEFMTTGCLRVQEKTNAGKVLEMMREKRIGEIPVIDESEKIAGLADLKSLISSL